MSGGRLGREAGLRELLARLRERLGQSRSMDADSRDHLSAVVSDIDGELGLGAGAVSAHAPRLESLAKYSRRITPGWPR